jgi:hypothetical protein
MRYRLDPLSQTGLSVVEPKPLKNASGAFVSSGVDSISKAGSAQLKRNVTLSAGSNITLTQTGQNIQISSTGGSGGVTWIYLATSWDSAPTVNKVITGGTVFNYILSAVTKYRFVPDPYVSSSDAFYEDFDNINDILTNLVITRAT